MTYAGQKRRNPRSGNSQGIKMMQNNTYPHYEGFLEECQDE